MLNQTSHRLENNTDKILSMWEERVNNEIKAAQYQGTAALRDSLPEYLKHIANALSNTIDRTAVRNTTDKIDGTRIGKKHGEDRAGSKNYTIDQLISEYHILRQVIFDVMEAQAPLSDLEREVILCSIEQAVNDAATEYSDILKKFQKKISNTLTHDLRGPITSSKLGAQMVLKKLDADNSSVSKLELIISNMNRLEKMIAEVLDASRLDAGHTMPVEFQSCDFDSIIREVIRELSLSCPDCFEVQSDGKCQGYWDENGMRRIVENLTSNAIKYGDENKPVRLSLTEDRDSIELRVHNFGVPIPPNEIPILFEQYRRLRNAKDKSGWGLGLTLVKGMVEAHSGSIAVESQIIEGTTFIIKLPRDARKENQL